MRSRHIVLLFLLLLFDHTNCFGQCAVSGSISDSSEKPMPFVTVALLNQNDSTVFKGVLTREKGDYCFDRIKKGNFIIKVSGMGFNERYSAGFVYDSINSVILPHIVIGKNEFNLGEVSVESIKNPIEFKGGNITVNVENSPLAVGNSAYELLSQVPGVMVENDNISIQGKSGIKVYIDDRMLQMSGAQLISFLRSINAGTIEKIEIINNPPARYDAAGSGGIINIKTKKIKVTGLSGNLNYTFSQGFYSTNRGGFSLNYKGKKFAVFSNVNGYEGLLRQQTDYRRTIGFNGDSTTLIEESYEIDAAHYLYADLGIDWYINPKNTIGVKAQIIPGQAVRTFNGETTISDTSLGYDKLIFNRPVTNTWYMLNYNLNAEHLFDTLGTRLRLSVDYYNNYDIYSGFYQNHFYSENVLSADPLFFKSVNALEMSILAGRLDFEKKFGKGFLFEAGIKQNYQDISSDYELANKESQSNVYVADSTFTNKFSYREGIAAGYLTVSKEYKKINLQLGLRSENTSISTTSHTRSISYTRRYLNFFPVLSTDYNPSQNHSFSLSYNRRIFRPDYNSYNPFRSFVNILNSSEGNPYLNPVYDNNINFSYIFKRKISNFLSYSYTENPIYGYTTQVDSTRETIFHVMNVKYATLIRYNLFIRQEIKKWWIVSLLAGAYYVDYTATFNGLNYYARAIPYYTRLTFLFQLKKDIKVEASGFYWSPWLGGGSINLSRGGLSWSVKKSFLKNRLFVAVGMNDVFFTEPFRSKADLANQNWYRNEAHDSRRVNVSINYDFGKVKVEQRRTKENDEEKRRLGH